MQSPISYAIGHIRYEIHDEIIRMAFQPDRVAGFADAQSVEELIRRRVIEQRVLPDIDLAGGEHAVIELTSLSYSRDDRSRFYQVPMASTNGRHITSVQGLETNLTAYNDRNRGIYGATQALVDAAAGPESTGTASVYLVGPNTIEVTESVPLVNIFLRCRLGNDRNANNLMGPASRPFADLCLLACKQYIYKTLHISIGNAAFSGGTINENIRAFVDRMEDASEQYREALIDWQRIAVMADTPFYHRMLRVSMG